MADYKPTDFHLGLVDLFSILLPGVVLLGLTVDRFRGEILEGFPSLTGQRGWIAFFVGAYVTGHVLKHVGTDVLNRCASRLSARLDRSWQDKDLEETVLHKLRAQPGFPASESKPYRWARAFVRVQNERASGELDRLEAESKFFRSLCVGLLFACPLLFDAACRDLPQKNAYYLAFGALFLCAFAFRRFCRLRCREAYLTNAYFLVLEPAVKKGWRVKS